MKIYRRLIHSNAQKHIIQTPKFKIFLGGGPLYLRLVGGVFPETPGRFDLLGLSHSETNSWLRA